MADGRGPRAGGRLDSSTAAEGPVAEWLRDLAEAPDGVVRTPRLLAAYEVLARAAIEGGLRATGAEEEEWPADVPTLDRALAETAAAVRRSRLTISQSLGDLDRLAPILLRRVVRGSQASVPADEALEAVEAAARLLDVLGGVSRRLSHVLEASAVRQRRERAETLAALTDQLSHELQNRLGAAQTAADMLLDPSVELDESGLAEVARLVRVSVEAALRTVGDVRDLVASRTNAEEPVPRPTRLPRLIRAVLDELSASALEAGVTLGVEGDDVECEVDAARLRLIVFNLVGNGIKYGDAAKDERWVRLRCASVGEEHVEVRVSDNGIGIPERELDGIFLHRSRGAETGGMPGSGLGLAIVREAIDQIGGSICVESTVGEGSTFTVRFVPLRWPDSPV